MMGASEKAVAAVMEALEHHNRYMEIPNGRLSCHCGETGWVTKDEYRKHVAVAAADAAVDTDRPTIQAQARDDEGDWWRSTTGTLATGAYARGDSDRRRAFLDLMALDERRDRIEAQP